jgi:Asp-tRNA(Asn)/Glu-tRNA(Gln) amidotransferase A subunit family amidase
VLIVPTYAGRQLAITNLTGHPSITVPIGFNKNGLPHSITFIGKLYDEVSILRAAAWFQSHTNFDEQHPPKFLD